MVVLVTCMHEKKTSDSKWPQKVEDFGFFFIIIRIEKVIFGNKQHIEEQRSETRFY